MKKSSQKYPDIGIGEYCLKVSPDLLTGYETTNLDGVSLPQTNVAYSDLRKKYYSIWRMVLAGIIILGIVVWVLCLHIFAFNNDKPLTDPLCTTIPVICVLLVASGILISNSEMVDRLSCMVMPEEDLENLDRHLYRLVTFIKSVNNLCPYDVYIDTKRIRATLLSIAETITQQEQRFDDLRMTPNCEKAELMAVYEQTLDNQGKFQELSRRARVFDMKIDHGEIFAVAKKRLTTQS